MLTFFRDTTYIVFVPIATGSFAEFVIKASANATLFSNLVRFAFKKIVSPFFGGFITLQEYTMKKVLPIDFVLTCLTWMSVDTSGTIFCILFRKASMVILSVSIAIRPVCSKPDWFMCSSSMFNVILTFPSVAERTWIYREFYCRSKRSVKFSTFCITLSNWCLWFRNRLAKFLDIFITVTNTGVLTSFYGAMFYINILYLSYRKQKVRRLPP